VPEWADGERVFGALTANARGAVRVPSRPVQPPPDRARGDHRAALRSPRCRCVRRPSIAWSRL